MVTVAQVAGGKSRNPGDSCELKSTTSSPEIVLLSDQGVAQVQERNRQLFIIFVRQGDDCV